MKKGKIIFIISFIVGILLLINNDVSAQGFSFQDPITKLWNVELEGWQIDQMYRDEDELKALRKEVQLKSFRIETLTSISFDHLYIINAQDTIISGLYFIIDRQTDKIKEVTGLYNGAIKLNTSYSDELSKVQWELIREKVKSSYYKWGTAIGSAILVGIIIRDRAIN